MVFNYICSYIKEKVSSMKHFTALKKYILTEFPRRDPLGEDSEYVLPTEPGVYITANANERFRLLESGQWEEWDVHSYAYAGDYYEWTKTYAPKYDTLYGPVPST